MFLNGKINPTYAGPKTLWGPRQNLGWGPGVKTPQARQTFDPSLQSLGYVYRGVFGADPMEGLKGIKLGDRLKAARRGDKAGTPEAALREVFGYLEARPEDASYFNQIFSQFNEKELYKASKSARHLDPFFGEEFTSGASRYFQEKGDWEWDFEANKWKRSAAGAAKFGLAQGRERLKAAGPMSTMTAGFGKTHVKKETY